MTICALAYNEPDNYAKRPCQARVTPLMDDHNWVDKLTYLCRVQRCPFVLISNQIKSKLKYLRHHLPNPLPPLASLNPNSSSPPTGDNPPASSVGLSTQGTVAPCKIAIKSPGTAFLGEPYRPLLVRNDAALLANSGRYR